MKLIIKKQDGTDKVTVSAASNSTLQQGLMGDDVLNLSFTLPQYVPLAVNDYIEFNGINYSLLKDYEPTQKSTLEYNYSPKFYGIVGELKRALVINQADESFDTSFSLFGTPAEHLKKVVDNINRIKGGNLWTIGNVISAGYQNIEYKNRFCFDALADIANAFETEWWIEGTTINLCRCEHGVSIELGYHKGLTDLSRSDNESEVRFFTRLIPLGSTKNIDSSRYGATRLQLPGHEKFVEQNTHYGIIEAVEETAFAGIYPRRTGIVGSVRAESTTDKEGNPITIYYFTDPGMNFDPNDYEIGGLKKHVVFQSGNLNGRDFEVNFNSKTKEIEIINQYSDNGVQMPGSHLIPAEGNTYILYNITMPDSFYQDAEIEFQTAVNTFLSKYSEDISVYKGNTDYVYINKNKINLSLGSRVRLLSPEYFKGTGYRESRITSVTRNICNPGSLFIECSSAVGKGRADRMETDISQMKSVIAEQLDKDTFSILKTWDSSDITNFNVFSSLRAVKETERRALSKLTDDVTVGHITFENGILVKSPESNRKLSSAVTEEKNPDNPDKMSPQLIEESDRPDPERISAGLFEQSETGGGFEGGTIGDLDNVDKSADQAADGAILLFDKKTGKYRPVSGAFIKSAEIAGNKINSVEDFIGYLNVYGTGYPAINTAPTVIADSVRYVFKPEDDMKVKLLIQDNEGGIITLSGRKPEGTYTSGEEDTWKIEGLRVGELTLDLNKILFTDPAVRLQIGTHQLTEIYATDAFGRRSVTPVTLEVIVGSISLITNFNEDRNYPSGESVSIGYSVMSVMRVVEGNFEFGGSVMKVSEDKVVMTEIGATKTESVIELSVDDKHHIPTQYYGRTFITPILNEPGEYFVRMRMASTDGSMQSREVTVNMVSVASGVVYTGSSLDTGKTYYADETYAVPVSVHSTGSGVHTTRMWIDGINEVTEFTTAKNAFEMSVLLPEEANTYTICLQTVMEGFIGNVCKITLMAQSKSLYSVLTQGQYNLELYLNAKGYRNDTSGLNVWANKYYLPQNYYGEMTDYNSLINGWEEQTRPDKLNGDCLYSNGASYTRVHYRPFTAYSLKNNKEGEGVTIEFSIHNGNLENENAFTLTCGDKNASPLKGFYLNTQMMKIYFGNSVLDTPVVTDTNLLTKRGEWLAGTDEYIHIALRFDYFRKEVAVFINGIISGYSTYADHTDVEQNGDIYINGHVSGSGADCFSEVKVRFLRVYQKALTNDELVNNYIASIQYDEDRELAEKLNDELVPVLSHMNMWGNRYGATKDDAVKVDATFVVGNENIVSDNHLFDPVADGDYGQQYMDWSEKHPMDVAWQGNSSLAYPVKNYAFDIYDPEYLAANQEYESKKFDMTRNADDIRCWYPHDGYHCKCNYIDSSHCNNVISAKIADYVYRMPYNWSVADCQTYVNGYDSPFPYHTVNGNKYSRYPLAPIRLAIDAAPFWLNAQNMNASGNLTGQQFAGLYTWGLKQDEKLYSMKDYKKDAWRKNTIWRSESNGDSVHPQLRSLSYGFFSMKDASLKVDLKNRPLTAEYISRNNLVEGVDYYDLDLPVRADMRAAQMKWRIGAETVMDFECRNPKSLGTGHWEKSSNGSVWTPTDELIDPKDMGSGTAEYEYRWVWDEMDGEVPKRKKSEPACGYYNVMEDMNRPVAFLGSEEASNGMIDETLGQTAFKQHLDFIEMMRWVDKCPDAQFADPAIFNKYINLQSAVDYCVMAIVFYMADSLGRNLTMVQWDNREIDKTARALKGRFPQFHPVFYDMDTVFGTNVQGGLTTDAYVGWQYPIGKDGKYYKPSPDAMNNYNCGESRFFRRMTELYGDAIARRYKDLRSGVKGFMGESYDAPMSYNFIIKMYCTEMVGRIGEKFFNKDAVYKYIGEDYDSADTKAAKRKYIINSRGNKLVFMKNFLKKRLEYCDGLFRYEPEGSAVSEMTYFQHNFVGMFSFRILTSVPAYMRVSFAQNQSTYIYCDGVSPVAVNYEYQGDQDGIVSEKILRIYNTRNVIKLTGLDNKKLNKAKLSSCYSLQELDLSNNPTLNELVIDGCVSLKKINLTNCNYSQGFSCNIAAAFFLEEFIARNSTVKAGNFSRNSYLKSIDVRECANVTDLNVNGLKKLVSMQLTHANIFSLDISDSSCNPDLTTNWDNLLKLICNGNTSVTQLGNKIVSTAFPRLTYLDLRNCPKLNRIYSFILRDHTLSEEYLNSDAFDNILLGCSDDLIGSSEVNTNIGYLTRENILLIFAGTNIHRVPNSFNKLMLKYKISSVSSFFRKCTQLTDLNGFLCTPKLPNGEYDSENNPCKYITELTYFPADSGCFEDCGNLKHLPEGFMAYMPNLSEFINAYEARNRLFWNTGFSDELINGKMIYGINRDFLYYAPRLGERNINTFNIFRGAGRTGTGFSISEKFLANTTLLTNCSALFQDSYVTSIPDKNATVPLLSTCKQLANLTSMFFGTKLLTSVCPPYWERGIEGLGQEDYSKTTANSGFAASSNAIFRATVPVVWGGTMSVSTLSDDIEEFSNRTEEFIDKTTVPISEIPDYHTLEERVKRIEEQLNNK